MGINFLPPGKTLILASKSPRRQQLLRDMGIEFKVRTKEVEEDHPEYLRGDDIALFLAEKKAMAHEEELSENEIVLTSDTVVWCDGESLAKPANADEAKIMLRKISNKQHEVITAICLLSKSQREIACDVVKVKFRELEEEEIDYYIEKYKPFDKAGAYGIQEWIGMVGISSIKGSYFSVVGLPTHLVVEKLKLF